MMTASFLLMALLLMAMLFSEARKADRRVYGGLKIAGAVLFVATGVALVDDVPGVPWARPVFILALVLSLVGDVALIPKGHRSIFFIGLVSFLLAHIAYVPAFLGRGIDPTVTAVVGVAVIVPIVLVLRWLKPKVKGSMWPAVVAYVFVISAMLCAASGAVAAGLTSSAGVTPPLLLGAFAFWLSDICVARERFVKPGFINRLIGLPLYFFAQLGLIAGYQ